MAPVRGIARALLGGVFIFSGAKAVLRPERFVQRARPVTDRVTPLLTKVDERIPASAEALVRVNGAAQLAGGLLLAAVDTAGSPSVGWRVRHYLESRKSDG